MSAIIPPSPRLVCIELNPGPSCSGVSFDYFLPPIHSLLLTWSRPLTLLLTTISLFLFITFCFSNSLMVTTDFIFLQIHSTVAWLCICMFVMGLLSSGVIFYIRQRNLLLEISSLRLLSEQHRLAHERFKSCASQILIPYPLDELIEKAGVNERKIGEGGRQPQLVGRGNRR